MYEQLGIFAVFILCYSLIAGRVARSSMSGPILYIGFGLLAGPMALGIIDVDVDSSAMRRIVDLTLAVILFIDAAAANRGVVRRFSHIPGRMLLFGLPLTIACGTLLGSLVLPELALIEVAILATVLAATDAALGKPVITNPDVPERLREGLNVESGLNDGICVPILFLLLAIAVQHESGMSGTGFAFKLFAQELGIGIVVGVALAALGSWGMKHAARLGWLDPIWAQVPVIALALASFAIAQSLHGSGYVAAFVGGMAFGHFKGAETHKLLHSAEALGETLALVTWVIFGALVVGQTLSLFSWQIVFYAVCSLSVVRMLPIFLSLTGMGETTRAKLFMGWFGPRGLASIAFIIIVAGQKLPGADTMILTVFCTVVLSVILHGVSANPLAKYMASRATGA